jgi:uncharacterized membrane protein YhhN
MQTKPPIAASIQPPGVSKCSLAFLILGAASATLVLAARPLLQTWHVIPNTPLTTLCFLIVAAGATSFASARYKWSIVAGLGFSALGDLFLMLPNDRFVPGLASFLIAHICYLWGLTSDTRLAEGRVPFLIAGGIGLMLLVFLWPGVKPSLRFPVMLYTIALLGMAAQANARALIRRDRAATFAALGAILFVASDAGLAIHRFGHPFPFRHLVVLGTYFGAQAGLALSVVLQRQPSGKEPAPLQKALPG